jgi:uncharacterized protein YkwD
MTKTPTKMKTLQTKIPLIFAFVLLLTSCTPEDDGIFFDSILETKTVYSDIELEILDLVNNYRATKNLNPLEKLNIISSVALDHTNYMVEKGEVNHDNFAERHEKLVLNADALKVGENVAYGYSSAKSVVNAWIKSDGHREIIENEDYTHFGISTEMNDEGRYFFTQLFIEQQ